MTSLAWQPATLETDRLLLRPVSIADAAAVFGYASNPNVTRFTLWEAHQRLSDSDWFLGEYAQSRYVNSEPDPLAIQLRSGQLIGTIGGFWISKFDGVMEFGYSLGEPYWGQGLMVEAATAFTKYLFENFPVVRLQARVLVGNDASERVLAKLGFQKEGILRSLIFRKSKCWDVAIYSCLRTELERISPVEVK